MNIAKYFRILIFWIGLFFVELVLLFVIIEYSGIFNLTRSIYRISIGYEEAQDQKYQDIVEYYGKDYSQSINQISVHPYEPFNIQYIHPFFLFSSAWRDKQIQITNNSVVSVEPDGFRPSYDNLSSSKGIILGGSTAFGGGATSDLNTISSVLNLKQSSINFRNRAIQSWNSHQELISLVKSINNEDEYVISLTGFNDLVNGWAIKCTDEELPLDAHHDFLLVEKVIGDIKDFHTYTNFSEVVRTYLPKTHRLAVKINQHFFNDGNIKITSFCDLEDQDFFDIAETFIENQLRMVKISESYGANFYTVIQPNAHLHNIPSSLVDFSDQSKEITYNLNGDLYTLYANTYNPLDDSEYDPRLLNYSEKYFSIILKSDYCKNYCIDATNIFDNQNEPLSNFLIDAVHLKDSGTETLVDYLLENINIK